MIIHKLISRGLIKKTLNSVLKIQTANLYSRETIGNREWVGYGHFGTACYLDTITCPFPSVRWKENTNEILALREKEKGDWRKLTIEEKKTLYRASFRQTIAEAYAPTGEWKWVLAIVLVGTSLGIWAFIAQYFLFGPKLPETFKEEHRRKMFRHMLVNKTGHLTGYSSKWDYELDDWKK